MKYFSLVSVAQNTLRLHRVRCYLKGMDWFELQVDIPVGVFSRSVTFKNIIKIGMVGMT